MYLVNSGSFTGVKGDEEIHECFQVGVSGLVTTKKVQHQGKNPYIKGEVEKIEERIV